MIPTRAGITTCGPHVQGSQLVVMYVKGSQLVVIDVGITACGSIHGGITTLAIKQTIPTNPTDLIIVIGPDAKIAFQKN